MTPRRCYSQPEWPNLASVCVPPPWAAPVGTLPGWFSHTSSHRGQLACQCSLGQHSVFPIIFACAWFTLPRNRRLCKHQLSNITLPQAINTTQTCTPIISRSVHKSTRGPSKTIARLSCETCPSFVTASLYPNVDKMLSSGDHWLEMSKDATNLLLNLRVWYGTAQEALLPRSNRWLCPDRGPYRVEFGSNAAALGPEGCL